MIKKLFQRKFERNQHSHLPPKATRILKAVARDYLIRGNLNPKQIEIAHAVLHMRMYQQFGEQSSMLLPIADAMLKEMTELPSQVPVPA